MTGRPITNEEKIMVLALKMAETPMSQIIQITDLGDSSIYRIARENKLGTAVVGAAVQRESVSPETMVKILALDKAWGGTRIKDICAKCNVSSSYIQNLRKRRKLVLIPTKKAEEKVSLPPVADTTPEQIGFNDLNNKITPQKYDAADLNNNDKLDVIIGLLRELVELWH